MRIKQNEELMLKIQYAARQKYNCAEIMCRLAFWLCLVPILSLIPSPECFQKAETIIVICLDLAIIILTILYTRLVEDAASFRSYFDFYVFGFSMTNDLQNKQIKEKAIQIFNKHIDRAAIQIANTGKDTPPGVRDWYAIPESKNDSDTIYICQSENAWWTSKMFIGKCISLLLCWLFIILIAVILKLINAVDWWDLFLAFVSITIKLLERIICVIRFLFASIRLEGAINVLSTNRTKKQLSNLQNLIDHQRRIPFLPSNRLHKTRAKELSILYRESNIV
ncbi:MAG: hypothetical protein IKK74_06325 [Clostridia bacterium]|nr:hypothetical protein [Clostridia bacterium]